MIRVIHSRNTAPTAGLLQEALANTDKQGTVNWTGAAGQAGSLNEHSFTDKLRQLTELKTAHVCVPRFELPLERWPRLPPHPGWMPRTLFHRGGRDFRRRITPDFWVEPLSLKEEWRVHVFKTKKGNMRVIRCAKKIPLDANAHPWIRNHDYGWKFSYIDGCADLAKETARDAIRFLNLDFGAVDLGIREDDLPIVLEVNTCPGLDEGNTLTKYAENIVERF